MPTVLHSKSFIFTSKRLEGTIWDISYVHVSSRESENHTFGILLLMKKRKGEKASINCTWSIGAFLIKIEMKSKNGN